MAVHNDLGWGLLGPIYNEALYLELKAKGTDSEPEKYLHCYYKGQPLQKFYKMDLVIGDIIMELKSVSDVSSEHRAQLFNYLRLTKKPVGLLINFGEESLYGERYGYAPATNECILLDKNMEPFYDNVYK